MSVPSSAEFRRVLSADHLLFLIVVFEGMLGGSECQVIPSLRRYQKVNMVLSGWSSSYPRNSNVTTMTLTFSDDRDTLQMEPLTVRGVSMKLVTFMHKKPSQILPDFDVEIYNIPSSRSMAADTPTKQSFSELNVPIYVGHAVDTSLNPVGGRVEGTLLKDDEGISEIFYGRIVFPFTTVYVEPAHKYCHRNATSRCSGYNAILFEEKDMTFLELPMEECEQERRRCNKDRRRRIPSNYHMRMKRATKTCVVDAIADPSTYSMFSRNKGIAAFKMAEMVRDASVLFDNLDIRYQGVRYALRLRLRKVLLFPDYNSLSRNSRYSLQEIANIMSAGSLAPVYEWATTKLRIESNNTCLTVVVVNRHVRGRFTGFSNQEICRQDISKVPTDRSVALITYQKDGVPFTDRIALIQLTKVLAFALGMHPSYVRLHCIPRRELARRNSTLLDTSRYQNVEFSECAKDDVVKFFTETANIDECLIEGESEPDSCGNNYQEPWEECDCATQSDVCDPTVSPCCTTQQNESSWNWSAPATYDHRCLEGEASRAVLFPRSCPSLETGCCTPQCELSGEGERCTPLDALGNDEECVESVGFCDGLMRKCRRILKPDGTPCALGTLTCINGTCTRKEEEPAGLSVDASCPCITGIFTRTVVTVTFATLSLQA